MNVDTFVQIFGRFLHRDNDGVHAYFLPVSNYVWGQPFGNSDFLYVKRPTVNDMSVLESIELNSGISPIMMDLL